MPIPMVMGAFSARYSLYALTHPDELQRIAEALSKSLAVVQVIVVLIGILGLASILLLSYASYMLYKHRHAFL